MSTKWDLWIDHDTNINFDLRLELKTILNGKYFPESYDTDSKGANYFLVISNRLPTNTCDKE